MEPFQQIITSGKKTVRQEAEALLKMVDQVGDSFAQLVQKILLVKGRVVVTGVGKSAIIANKIVATLNSTGTPALYMHAADAIHGDLGMIGSEDVMICISKSGNTEELKALVPLLKRNATFIAAIVGQKKCYLQKQADLWLDVSVDSEACPNNLAPTTSTTAQLVIGDALAVALLEQRRFGPEDFARFHPGGSLGKKLYLTLGELATLNEKPAVGPKTPLKQTITVISKHRLGASAVLDENGDLCGMITDGDIRRAFENLEKLDGVTAADIMSRTPKSMDRNELAAASVDFFKKNNITQLLITDDGHYFGIVHFHDLLKEGII